jgi:hypothetical protein
MVPLTIETIDNTNSKHLELYTILGEYNNTGFPLSYCLLTTASSLEDRKCTQVLESWGTILCDTYGLVPRFVHTDKDMAEIGASWCVWPAAKHQLCWWHQHEALRRRLKGNLPTSSYNAQWAQHKHPFISLTFVPHGCMDPNDCEGGMPGEIYKHVVQKNNVKTVLQTNEDPNSIKIQIPVLSQSMPGQTIQKAGDDTGGQTLTGTQSDLLRVLAHLVTDGQLHDHSSLLGLAEHSVTGAGYSAGGLTLGGSHPMSLGNLPEQRMPPDNSKLVIRIPALSTIRETGPVADGEPDADEETTPERHTFCPIEHCTTVVEIMEHHFCAHPLIPGYSAPTPEGIKAWAVKQMYEFCAQLELPNLWAYLWENWY